MSVTQKILQHESLCNGCNAKNCNVHRTSYHNMTGYAMSATQKNCNMLFCISVVVILPWSPSHAGGCPNESSINGDQFFTEFLDTFINELRWELDCSWSRSSVGFQVWPWVVVFPIRLRKATICLSGIILASSQIMCLVSASVLNGLSVDPFLPI